MDFIKIEEAKARIKKSATKKMVWGIIFLVVFVPQIITYFALSGTDEQSAGTFVFLGLNTLVLAFLGLLMILRSISNRKFLNRYEKYIVFIRNGFDVTLNEMAIDSQVPYKTVMKDIPKMIKVGLLPGCGIDALDNRLVLPSEVTSNQNNRANNSTNTATNATMVAKSVKCPACGAPSTIMGNHGTCKYCGAPIDVE